jgi:ubiquinone/menaquinone biosynthesis C-methylase UbiE
MRKAIDINFSPAVTTSEQIAIDWTSTVDYKKLTAEELEKYSNVEITADLREGGVHAQKAWGFWFEYLSKKFWKSSLSQEIVEFSNTINNPRILSLGCGYGGVEITIARSLSQPYEIVATDINNQIFAKAREEARLEGLNIHFLQLDLNFISLQENTFDLMYAHASLHHLLNLEHIFSQIHRGLKKNGRLIVQDIIGKTQVLFWKNNVDFARDIVKKMPDRYKAGIAHPDEIIAPYREPSIQQDMEGIRQEEIELQAGKFFTPIKMFKYGSFIRLICTHPELGRRLDPDMRADREYLEYLFQQDLQQVQMEKLRPTEMLAVYIKKDSADLP